MSGLIASQGVLVAQAGVLDTLSWPWVIGIAVAILIAGGLYLVLRAGRAPDREIRLVVTRGLHTGKTFTLSSAFATIGTEKDNDLVLGDDKISRHHARLKFHGGQLEVTDLNTLHGTIVNGERVEKRDCLDGDMLGLGPMFECRVEIAPRS